MELVYKEIEKKDEKQLRNLIKTVLEGFDYIISMAHPDNIASKKALMKLGLDYVKTTTVNQTFLRDIFMMKLKEI